MVADADYCVASLLAQDRDGRIALDSNGVNKYLRRPTPNDRILAFGSSTASTISERACEAARRVLEDWTESADKLGADRALAEAEDELRTRIPVALGLKEGLTHVGLSPSGTDAIAAVSAWLRRVKPKKLSVVIVQETETGSGVFDALGGGLGDSSVIGIDVRSDRGDLLDPDAVDFEFAKTVASEIARGRHVLLCLTDSTKTDLVVPSPDVVARLCALFQDDLTVLVDACQARVTPERLEIYLDAGFVIAVTGSKFYTGPVFSGALLVRKQSHLPECVQTLDCIPSRLGLVLRWEAALSEMTAFRNVPAEKAYSFLQVFGKHARSRLESNPYFRPLVGRLDPIERSDFSGSIFPFTVQVPDKGGGMHVLDREELLVTCAKLARIGPSHKSDDRIAGIEFGQPVQCGRGRQALFALRICCSSRLVVAACEAGRGNELLASIDKALDELVIEASAVKGMDV